MRNNKKKCAIAPPAGERMPLLTIYQTVKIKAKLYLIRKLFATSNALGRGKSN